MTYNEQGKRITSENLAGQVMTTAWDCSACTPVGELIPAAKYAKSAEIAYGFDDIGNRETSSERGTNSVYAANQLNQYCSITTLTSDAGLQTSSFSPQFDDDGNQALVKTETGNWSIFYNGENRPIQWTLVNSSTSNSSISTLLSMTYDRMGRRVTKNDQCFTYGGYLQIADNHGNVYVWDPVEPVATHPLAWFRGNFGACYTYDGNKNVSEVIGSNGDAVAHYEYAPFGTVVAEFTASAENNPWRFSSEYSDDMIGLVYYDYRHYEPMTGRWFRRDPVSDLYGLLNQYSYISNQILDAYDYLRLECERLQGGGLSLKAEASVYQIFEGSVSFSVEGMVYDCCCNGQINYLAAYEIGLSVSANVGIGFGASFLIPGMGRVGFDITGPQYSLSAGASVSKDCADEESSFVVTLVDQSGDLGLSVSVGKHLGLSVGYWAKYGLTIEAEVHGKSATFTGSYGWHGGGEWELSTPFVNVSGVFEQFDKKGELFSPTTLEW